jgi:outer membrane lipoprotein SlyB
MSMRIVFTLFAAVFLAACAAPADRYYGSGAAGYGDPRYAPRYGTAPRYATGVVQRIDQVRTTGETTGAGAALGGVVGGVLGSQVGGGRGQTAATIAGAAGGAAVGHSIERDRVRDVYELTVRMDDGRQVVVQQRDLRGVRPGARVQIVNGEARLI